jgi:hypothetical protein
MFHTNRWAVLETLILTMRFVPLTWTGIECDQSGGDSYMYFSSAIDPNSGISRDQCLSHSKICPSYRTYGIDDFFFYIDTISSFTFYSDWRAFYLPPVCKNFSLYYTGMLTRKMIISTCNINLSTCKKNFDIQEKCYYNQMRIGKSERY